MKNVVAVLEGEGPHAEETIVVGAHYDHLGYGGQGSFFPGEKEIHNGADDNGSGTAALVEVARRLAMRDKKLPRRVVFIAFTGEERGLIGSARYCREPLVPLDKTVAMLNMDMVGRLDDDKLIVQGVDTAAEFEPLDRWAESSLRLRADQEDRRLRPQRPRLVLSARRCRCCTSSPACTRTITGPRDDFEKINVPGMRRVAEMVADTAVAIAEADHRPTFAESKSSAPAGGGDGDRPYFGSDSRFRRGRAGLCDQRARQRTARPTRRA